MKIESLKESEKKHLLIVLEKTHWDLEKTSRLLKISLQSVKSKIKEYGISRSDIKFDSRDSWISSITIMI